MTQGFTAKQKQELVEIVTQVVDKSLDSKLEEKLEPILEKKFEEKLKPIKKALKKLDEDLGVISNFLDRENLALEKRVIKIENVLNL